MHQTAHRNPDQQGGLSAIPASQPSSAIDVLLIYLICRRYKSANPARAAWCCPGSCCATRYHRSRWQGRRSAVELQQGSKQSGIIVEKRRPTEET